MQFRTLVLGSLLALTSTPAAAQSTGWAELARIDVEAAYGLIHDNHPGAAPDQKDDAFAAALEKGHAEALRDAAAARTYSDYLNSLRRFAAVFGDAHIGVGPKVRFPALWPGFIAEYRFDKWVVASSEAEGAPSAGLQLVSVMERAPRRWRPNGSHRSLRVGT